MIEDVVSGGSGGMSSISDSSSFTLPLHRHAIAVNQVDKTIGIMSVIEIQFRGMPEFWE